MRCRKKPETKSQRRKQLSKTNDIRDVVIS